MKQKQNPELVIGPEAWGQDTADQWPEGACVRLKPGVYTGPVRLSRRLELSSFDPKDRAVLVPGPDRGQTHQTALFLSGETGGHLHELDFRGEDFSHHALVHLENGRWDLENCRFQGAYAEALRVAGPQSHPRVKACVVHGGTLGIVVEDGAGGHFEANDILDHLHLGVSVRGAGTNPEFQGNGIQGCLQGGLEVRQGALGRFLNNNIYDNGVANVVVKDRQTAPYLEGNQIRRAKRTGLVVAGAAGGRYISNTIATSASTNVEVKDLGTCPYFHGNQICEGKQAGLSIHDGADGDYEENNIFGNELANVFVYQKGTDPHLTGNLIHNGNHAGISVYGSAEGLYEDNDIYENAQANVQVAHIGTDPVFRRNRIHRANQGGVFIQGGATGCFEENEIFDNAMANVEVLDSGSRPIFRDNMIHSCLNEGIFVQNGAAGRFEGNEVKDTGFNATGLGTGASGYPSIRIKDPGTEPHFLTNKISGSAMAAFEISNGAGGFYEDNEISETPEAGTAGFAKLWDVHWGTKIRRPGKKR